MPHWPDEVITVVSAVCRRHVSSLTTRQLEVLALLAEGWSNSAIAARLTITERAVVAHTSNIYDCLGIIDSPGGHRRVLATLAYLNG